VAVCTLVSVAFLLAWKIERSSFTWVKVQVLLISCSQKGMVSTIFLELNFFIIIKARL
jgi:hypothetical protein